MLLFMWYTALSTLRRGFIHSAFRFRVVFRPRVQKKQNRNLESLNNATSRRLIMALALYIQSRQAFLALLSMSSLWKPLVLGASTLASRNINIAPTRRAATAVGIRWLYSVRGCARARVSTREHLTRIVSTDTCHISYSSTAYKSTCSNPFKPPNHDRAHLGVFSTIGTGNASRVGNLPPKRPRYSWWLKWAHGSCCYSREASGPEMVQHHTTK